MFDSTTSFDNLVLDASKIMNHIVRFSTPHVSHTVEIFTHQLRVDSHPLELNTSIESELHRSPAIVDALALFRNEHHENPVFAYSHIAKSHSTNLAPPPPEYGSLS